ncbi:ABC-2 type transport system permease protein [Bacillus sp. TE9106W]|nr:ABC-2 family transporter protein [Bacillus cereus]
MRYFKLYFILQKANIQSRLMYPFNLFIGIISILFYGIFSTLFAWVLTSKFPIISGWNFYEMLFNISFNLLCYSLTTVFFVVHDIDTFVRNGEFDRILIRPMNSLFQFVSRRLDINTIGVVIYAIGTLFYSGSHLRYWDALSIMMAVVLLICGFITSTSISLILASTAFKTLQARGLFTIKEVCYENFCEYPLNIFSRPIQYIFTVIVPMGFIGFYPSVTLLNKSGLSIVKNVTFWWCVVVAFILLTLSVSIWNQCIKSYSSAGS